MLDVVVVAEVVVAVLVVAFWVSTVVGFGAVFGWEVAGEAAFEDENSVEEVVALLSGPVEVSLEAAAVKEEAAD